MPLANPQPSIDQNNVAISGGTISGVTVTSATLRIINGLDTQVSATKPTTRSGGSALVAGDRWLNTTDRLWYFWDGTYWLTEQIFPGIVSNATYSTNSYLSVIDVLSSYNYYFLDVSIFGQFNNTQDASNYWTVALQRCNFGNSPTNVGSVATASLNSTASNAFRSLSGTINIFVDNTALSVAYYRVALEKLNGTPGNLSNVGVRVRYRLVAV